MPASLNVVTLGLLSVTKSMATIGLLNDMMNRLDNKYRVRLLATCPTSPPIGVDNKSKSLIVIDNGATVCTSSADIHNIQIN
jgi:hypothetical protein